MTSFFFSSLLSVLLIPSFTANFSGKWVIEGQAKAPAQAGNILILNQTGNEVTGSMSARTDVSNASPVNTEILDGLVDGDTLKFYVWTGVDRPVKAFFKGTLTGDEIKFTVTVGTAAPVSAIARRAK